MSLMEMLARDLRDRDDDEPVRKTPPDVLCITLREIAARYAAPCPFKAGDLVTPQAGNDTKGAGNPHIVLEVIDRPAPDLLHHDGLSVGSNKFGQRRDMRIACESGGTLTTFWVESFQFEPYAGPVATLDAT